VTLTDQDAATRAWVDVDLDALVANARTVAARSERRLLPMIKANGYGLGAVPAARALEAIEPWGYGVATPQEGAELRAADVARPVVVFTPLVPAAIPTFLRHDLRPAIGDLEALRAWLATAGGRPFHLEIDTGMGRAGLRWSDDAAVAAAAGMLRGCEGWEGAFTHFHTAETDRAATDEQWERFAAVLAGLGARPPLVHAANSAAAMRGTRYGADLVRPGIYLYGGDDCGATPAPLPVATVSARVVATRRVAAGDTVSYGATWRAGSPTTIATLGIGYADGVPRSLANTGVAAVGGRIVPFAGRVTMDMTLVDAGDAAVAVGDVATIVGGPISLAEQARRAGTISYELLTALGPRLERRYGAAR
jgi:alanine racemase